ncbi:MAG TPA: hypothetical protein PLJ39_02090 [Spirochaetota bacterium]|nr:hypothetical protein [Spirochaetota bacterium]HPN29498.1 hypothetical protein [bacterium]HPN29519.1 hypothetical protein [bacterium]
MTWIIEFEENLHFLSNGEDSFPVQLEDLEELHCAENIGDFQTRIYSIMHSPILRKKLKNALDKDCRGIDVQLRELQNAVRELFDRET